jgi:acetyl esterase/lipase
MTNDLGNGFNVGKMTFNDSYTLSGNSLLLTGDWTFDQIKTFTCNVDLKIGAPLTLGRAITSEFYGTLDVNGQTLAIEPYNTTFHGPVNGSGTINVISDGVSFLAAGNFSGTLNGWVNVIGSMPNMNVIGGLSGDATVGNVTVQGDDLFWRPLIVGNTNPCCIDGHVIGTLNTKSFATTGRAWFDVSASGPSDVVHVNGNVSLGGDFILSLIGGAVPLGQTVTLIDNDGTDPVVGAFHFLPEGSLVLGSAPLFRISYHGGDGNDVTVTRVETSTTTISQSVASSKSGELFSLTANVLGGPAAGDVTFYDGATPLATVTLVSGTATLNTSLAQGTHSLTVRYAGSQMLTSSASPAIDHMVERGDSQTTLTASRTSSAYGDPITFSFGVNAVAPAIGTPAGSVALKRSSTQVGSSSLANGGGTLTLATLDAGHHVLTASFAGDANFSASSSSEVTVDIAKRATRTDARASRETIASGSHALIEVTISASHSAIPVTGVVQISEDGHTLAQSAISQSSATLDAGVFSTGDHTLVVSYLGATNFEASSTMVTLHVTLPSLSITDTSVVEGNSASKTYVVYARLSAPSSETVLVSYATEPGTAKEGEDFSAAQGTLTFAPGETTNAINLTIFGDTTAEDDETFTVTLSQPSKATLESSMAQITIVNDDIGYRASLGNVYATVALSSLTMDVYTPIEAKGGLPAVVWIPSINLYEPDSGATPPLRETNRGYVVVAANYRGASVAPFPAQLDDLKAAIRWLRANAARFNINPDRIAVWGHGTGAHLASLLGTTGDSVSAESLKEGNPSFSNQVQSVVDWAGVTDVAHLESDSPASCNANFIAQSQLGGSPSAESPLTFVNNGDAPFLIMHGAADCSVPLAQSQRFYDALRASNVPAILQVINGATPFDAYWFSAAAYGEVDAFLDANLKKAAKRRAAR